MKPKYQIAQNDCFSACLASILHLEVEDVPYFHKLSGSKHPITQEMFYKQIDEWLGKTFNLKLQYYPFNKLRNIPAHKYFIGCDLNHAFVCKNKEVLFDPYKTNHVCVCYSKWKQHMCRCKTHYATEKHGRFWSGILYGFTLIKRNTIRPHRKISSFKLNMGMGDSKLIDRVKEIILYS